MFGIGIPELLVLLGIILIIFWVRKLRGDRGVGLGKATESFKKATSYKIDQKEGKEKLQKIKKHIPVVIVGVSYVGVSLVKIIQILEILGSNGLFHVVLYTLLILLGIGLLYEKKFALILSLLSYPFIFITTETVQLLPWGITTPLFYTPFHHISFIILQKYALLSTVKSYWMIYLWGVYAIHLACLLPYLFKRRRRACEPKITFRFPEDAFIYEKNGFQVLGLLPDKATIRSITRRKSDLSALIRANLPFKDHLQDYQAVPWHRADPITEADINNAHARLQDSVKRIKEELFWFHLEENNEEAFGCLLKGKFERGRKLWKVKRENSPQTYLAAQALHNLAVLEHALVLAQERAIAGNPGMNDAQIENWKRVFGLWKDVYETDKCWEYFKKRIIYLNDPRITNGTIRRLRKELPELVLKINLEIARAALSQEMFEYAKQHLNLIKNSGFDPRDITKVVEVFFINFTKELRAIRQNLENQPNNRERMDLYREYENFIEKARTAGKTLEIKDKIIKLAPIVIKEYKPSLEKARNVKNLADKFDGCSYLKREVEEIILVLSKQIKKDLNIAIEKVIAISEEITSCANFLITLITGWNVLNDEDNARKLRSLKDAVKEATDIAEEGKSIFRVMEDLCCDENGKKQVRSEIEWLDKQITELWILCNRVISLQQSF